MQNVVTHEKFDAVLKDEKKTPAAIPCCGVFCSKIVNRSYHFRWVKP